MEHHKTMTAELKPDLYGGENCDEMRPEWHCQVEGDMGDDMNLQILTLDCSTFPPGTRVLIEEPACPDCGETRYQDDENNFPDKCPCGFDWNAWTRNTYG